jgi:hypothetical protein
MGPTGLHPQLDAVGGIAIQAIPCMARGVTPQLQGARVAEGRSPINYVFEGQSPDPPLLALPQGSIFFWAFLP